MEKILYRQEKRAASQTMTKKYFIPRSKQEPKNVFSVSQLNTRVQQLFDAELPIVWVSGEISNFTHHSSGHMYFTLKDESSQVRAAMFKGNNQRLKFTPKQGTQVIAQAKISLYSPRGDYQLVVQSMQQAGDGNLQQRFEALKNKLYETGLFSIEHKKPLPPFCYTIGVITSPTGAVIQDICHVLQRRAPWINVVLFPAKVQGENAKTEIVLALEKAQRDEYGCDAIILARGGGSLEDLWSFNEELVARAIADCSLPLISAVGHETDTTIADYVADVRAPTPSAAAELVTLDQKELFNKFDSSSSRLKFLLNAKIATYQNSIKQFSDRIKSPEMYLQEKAQRLDELNARAHWLISNTISRAQQRTSYTQKQLASQRPDKILNQKHTELRYHTDKLYSAWKQNQTRNHNQLKLLIVSLNNLSPLATLSRGYSVTRNASGQIIHTASDVNSGENVTTQLADGSIESIAR